MDAKQFLKEISPEPEKEKLAEIGRETKAIETILKSAVDKLNLKADVFVGGSFAKGTITSKKDYDVDIFIRFDWKYEEISKELEKVLKILKRKYKVEKVHGSRDYFRVFKNKNLVFEIIPVTKIKKPREMRNVTDLSYFHVNYVKNKIRGTKLNREIMLAKMFCKANKVYGAESYIKGFSGYALECLVINYGSFEKMIRELAKVKNGERLILDPKKQYKNKSDILFEINESKLASPVVLVDPTWKERNVLAALGEETFEIFQEAARRFLRNPGKSFFEEKETEEKGMKKEAKKKKGEFVCATIETDRQEGDIAGTKIKKFSDFLTKEAERYFVLIKKEFNYSGKQSGELYLIMKSKKEIIRIGPPANLGKFADNFRKQNKKVIVRDGVLQVKIKVNYSLKEFIKRFERENKEKIRDMGITKIKVN